MAINSYINSIDQKTIILLVVFKHLPGKSDYKDFIKWLVVGPEALGKVMFASLTKRHRVTSNLIGVLMNNIVGGIWFKVARAHMRLPFVLSSAVQNLNPETLKMPHGGHRANMSAKPGPTLNRSITQIK